MFEFMTTFVISAIASAVMYLIGYRMGQRSMQQEACPEGILPRYETGEIVTDGEDQGRVLSSQWEDNRFYYIIDCGNSTVENLAEEDLRLAEAR